MRTTSHGATPTAYGAVIRCRTGKMNRDRTIGSRRRMVAGLRVTALWMPLPSYAVIYSAEATEGWVADAETGKPIEGVIVVAHWRITGGLEGGTPINELKILETVTDEIGRYSFPAWGPKLAFLSGVFGSLGRESPQILMFTH